MELPSQTVISPITPEVEKASETTAKPENAENVETFTVDFRVTATALQLKALKAFLRNNHISYGRVPEKE